jgi:hypothetical protein
VVTQLQYAAVDEFGCVPRRKVAQNELFNVGAAYHFHHFFQVTVFVAVRVDLVFLIAQEGGFVDQYF